MTILLPKILKKREAKITSRRVEDFVRESFPDTSVSFEVKIRGRKVMEHQTQGLKDSYREGYYWKFPDIGYVRNKFDGIWISPKHLTPIVIWIENDGKLTIEYIKV